MMQDSFKPKGIAKIWREIKRPFCKKRDTILRISSIERKLSSGDERISSFEKFFKVGVLMQLSKLTGESMLRIEGVIDEYCHWEGVLDGTYQQYQDLLNTRLHADTEVIEPHLSILEELSRNFPINDIAILDVGAGPLTCINKLYKGIRLNITAIDALADYFDNLLKKYGIEPPIQTRLCKGEEIAHYFPKESFHWINARNSLDHMEFPVECIKAMLPLLKPGGMISLFHHPNVGTYANFNGFHQWNFSMEGNDFCISGRNGKNHTNVTKMLLPDYSTDTSLTSWPDKETNLKTHADLPALRVIVRYSNSES